MTRSNHVRSLVVMCLMVSAAMGAKAAGAYSLACEPARGGTITIPLIGFTFKVTGGAESPAGMAAGRRSSFDLTVRFAPSSAYQAMLSVAQTNEVLRSCKLVDGEGSGGATAKDNWTQMTVPKGMNNSKTGNAGPSTGGAMTWTFTNATVTSVTAIGNELPSGVTEGQIQATLSAERYEFAM